MTSEHCILVTDIAESALSRTISSSAILMACLSTDCRWLFGQSAALPPCQLKGMQSDNQIVAEAAHKHKHFAMPVRIYRRSCEPVLASRTASRH